MEVTYVPYSGKYTFKVTEDELKQLQICIENDIKILREAMAKGPPETFMRAGEQWLADRERFVAAIKDARDQEGRLSPLPQRTTGLTGKDRRRTGKHN